MSPPEPSSPRATDREPSHHSSSSPPVGTRLRWGALTLLKGYLRNRAVDRGKWFLMQVVNPRPGRVEDWRPYGIRTCTLRRGGRVQCNLIYALHRFVYITGEYEPAASRFMERALRRGWRFVDVGANVGYHAIPAAHAVDEVLCFEPNPGTRAMLEANLALNDLKNVRVLPVGLSDEDSEVPLFQNGLDIGGASLLSSLPNTGSQTIRIVRGDSAIPPSPLRTYLKIDVEGYELSVLKGLPRLLDAKNLLVQVEITDQWLRQAGGSAQALFDLMRSHGYHAYRLQTRSRVRTEPVLEPLAAPSPDFQYDVVFAPFERAEDVWTWLDSPSAT